MTTAMVCEGLTRNVSARSVSWPAGLLRPDRSGTPPSLHSVYVAVLAGLPLVLTISPWLLIIGIAAIAAAWFYTGGPKPYGYLGLGEVFVFVFFGLVATVGTTYVAIEKITALSVVLGCAAGALACAMLVVNNLRDMATDRSVGKHTLAVRIGDSATRRLYILLVSVPFLLIALVTVASPWAIITLTVAPLAIQPCRAVLNGAIGKELIGVLGATGRLQLAFGYRHGCNGSGCVGMKKQDNDRQEQRY